MGIVNGPTYEKHLLVIILPVHLGLCCVNTMNLQAEQLLHLVFEFQLKDSHLTVSHVRFAFLVERFFGQSFHSVAIN